MDFCWHAWICRSTAIIDTWQWHGICLALQCKLLLVQPRWCQIPPLGWSVTKHGFVMLHLSHGGIYTGIISLHAGTPPSWTSGSAPFQYQTSSWNTNNDKNHRFCSGELACPMTQKSKHPSFFRSNQSLGSSVPDSGDNYSLSNDFEDWKNAN